MVTLRTNPSFYFTFYLRYLPAFISSNILRLLWHVLLIIFIIDAYKHHMSRHYVFDVYQPDDTKLYYICIVLKHKKKIVYKTCLLILIFTRLRQKVDCVLSICMYVGIYVHYFGTVYSPNRWTVFGIWGVVEFIRIVVTVTVGCFFIS